MKAAKREQKIIGFLESRGAMSVEELSLVPGFDAAGTGDVGFHFVRFLRFYLFSSAALRNSSEYALSFR